MSPNRQEHDMLPISGKSIDEKGHRRPKLNTPKNRKKRRVSDEVFSIEAFDRLTISGGKSEKGGKSKKGGKSNKRGKSERENEKSLNCDVRLQCLPLVPSDYIPDCESGGDRARSSSVESGMGEYYL